MHFFSAYVQFTFSAPHSRSHTHAVSDGGGDAGGREELVVSGLDDAKVAAELAGGAWPAEARAA